jgi:SAM-dependent methyltransferase
LKPFRNLARTPTPDGSLLTLHEHDGEYFLKLNARQLMSTTSTASELLLAQLPCEGLRGRADTRVLIGGLGLGFSLRRVLELVGRHARVQVAELMPEVVAWNRDFLREVNGRLLEDRRVEVIAGDVFDVIRRAGPAAYDAMLLDVDNGPASMVQAKNARIYTRRGLEMVSRALKPGGKVSFWSAAPEPGFVPSLGRAGFKAEGFPAKAHERAKRAEHVIYLAEKLRIPALNDPYCHSPARHHRGIREAGGSPQSIPRNTSRRRHP